MAIAVGLGDRPVVMVSLIWTSAAEEREALIAEMIAAGTPLVAKAEPMPASDLLTLTDGKLLRRRGYEVATRWLERLTPDGIAALVAAFDARTSPLSSTILHHCHGAATEVAPDATAFGMRVPHFTALIYTAWDPAEHDADQHGLWARRLDAALAPMALPGGYTNLLPAAAVSRASGAYGPNASRLRHLKDRFDPAGMLEEIPLPPA